MIWVLDHRQTSPESCCRSKETPDQRERLFELPWGVACLRMTMLSGHGNDRGAAPVRTCHNEHQMVSPGHEAVVGASSPQRIRSNSEPPRSDSSHFSLHREKSHSSVPDDCLTVSSVPDRCCNPLSGNLQELWACLLFWHSGSI